MMRISDILKKAILSEKAYKQMEKGIYTFLVDSQSSKDEIAQAIKNQFSVDAVKVNVSHLFPKAKRIGRTRKQTLVGGGKKAIVQLKSGQSISMLSPKTESKKIKKIGKEKDTQKISAEGREA